MFHRFLEIALLSGMIGDVPVIDAPGFDKKTQEASVLATVRIINNKNGMSGSGVILNTSTGPVAYILTAGHVVGNADAVDVHVFSSKSYRNPQRVYKAVPVDARRMENNQDLALLRIAAYGGETAGLKVCTVANAPAGKPFAALAAGCDDGSPPILHSVKILNAVLAKKLGDKNNQAAKFWKSAVTPNQGASGGPLVDSEGRVLGICSGMQRQNGFFCHLEEIHKFLKDRGVDASSAK